MRTRRWIGLALAAAWSIGPALSAEPPLALEPTLAADSPDLLPPPPLPRVPTAFPKSSTFTQPFSSLKRPLAPVACEPMPTVISIAPAASSPSPTVISIAPAVNSSPSLPSASEPMIPEPDPVPTDGEGYVTTGMITYFEKSPPPVPKTPAPPAYAVRPVSEMTAYRGTTPSVKPLSSVPRTASPYAVVPLPPRGSQPNPLWGGYNRPASHAVLSPSASTQREKTTSIQGFKFAKAESKDAMQSAPAASVNVTPAQLQNRIMSECGGLAQKVLVTPQTDGSLMVEVRVRNNKEADDVSTRVLSLSEMHATKASLKVSVGQ